MSKAWPRAKFGEFLRSNSRPYTLGPEEDANLVGMRLYGHGPFHREHKPAMQIAKKTHFVIKAGDVTYNKLFAWKGTFGIVPAALDGMFVSDKFPTYELDDSKVDEGFVRWYFRYPPLWDQARGMSTGSAALSKLTLNPPRFLLLTMPMPPLAVQRRVVAQVEELAAQIGEARQLRQQATEECGSFVASHISRCFGEGARRGWSSGVLGDYITSDCYGTSEKTSDDSSGIPILRMGNIQNGRLTFRDLKYLHLQERDRAKLLLRRGDILVNRTNSAELVGKCAVFRSDEEFAFASYLIRLRIDATRADPRLIAAYINSPLGRAYMLREKKQMTGQANVNATQLRALPLVLPSLSVQQQIVGTLDALEVKVDAARALQIETAVALDALLPAILDRAFKGELV